MNRSRCTFRTFDSSRRVSEYSVTGTHPSEFINRSMAYDEWFRKMDREGFFDHLEGNSVHEDLFDLYQEARNTEEKSPFGLMPVFRFVSHYRQEFPERLEVVIESFRG